MTTMIQQLLDFNQPYGEILGGEGRGRYHQNGLKFDIEGKRVSKTTDEEYAAQKRAQTVKERHETEKKLTEEAVSKAVKGIGVIDRKIDEAAQKDRPEAPQFSKEKGWTKLRMRTYAYNEFGLQLSPKMTAPQMRAKLMDQY